MSDGFENAFEGVAALVQGVGEGLFNVGCYFLGKQAGEGLIRGGYGGDSRSQTQSSTVINSGSAFGDRLCALTFNTVNQSAPASASMLDADVDYIDLKTGAAVKDPFKVK